MQLPIQHRQVPLLLQFNRNGKWKTLTTIKKGNFDDLEGFLQHCAVINSSLQWRIAEDCHHPEIIEFNIQ